MVSPSMAPLVTASVTFLLPISFPFITKGMGDWVLSYFYLIPMIMSLVLCILYWQKEVTSESSHGFYTTYVARGLKGGFALFICSEVMLFFSFFWSFFHVSLVPCFNTGSHWPPSGIVTLDPMGVPLLNTTILLFSGITLTWAHQFLTLGDLKKSTAAMIYTIICGVYFLYLQYGEYQELSYSLADGIYGSIFFITTGFHGGHVMLGTILLLVSTLRLSSHSSYHLGFQFSAWYWHFVDVVWLFLYASIYWWGGFLLLAVPNRIFTPKGP